MRNTVILIYLMIFATLGCAPLTTPVANTPTPSRDAGQTSGTETSSSTREGAQSQAASPTATPKITSRYRPVNILEFGAPTEGEFIRFYFILQDQDGRPTPGDGHVTLTVLDDLENVLYHSELDIAASQFVDYQFKLTGQPVGKAYELRVPKADIKKGIATFWGKAVLTFVTVDGKQLTAENNTVDIPAYSEEELIQIAEQEYGVSAQPLQLQAEDENFQVKLTKIGYYTPYTSFGKPSPTLRADIEVLAKKSEYFWSGDTNVIDSNGTQYDVSYSSAFDFGELQQGAVRKGYLLFDNVPENVEVAMITINEYIFDLVSDRAYTYKQKAEEDYENLAVVLDQT